MKKSLVLLLLSPFLLGLIMAAAHGGIKATAHTPAMKAGVFEPPRQAPEFTLNGSDGTALTLNRYRGKVVLLGFGYTSCATVCPTTLSVLAQARKQLGASAADVQVVYVTVDPEHDDAKRMRDYLANFDPGFMGGTGTPEQLAAVRDTYGIAANKVTTDHGAGIDHSSFIYMIDREGRLRALMPFGRLAADYVNDVSLLLRK